MPWTLRRATGLVGALLAVTVLVTAGVTATQPSLVAANNSANYLSIDDADVGQESYESVGVDVSAAVSAETQRFHSEHERRSFERQYEQASDDPEQQEEIAEQATLDVERRLSAIDNEEAELVSGYSNGTVSDDRLLHELVRLDTTATQERQYLRTVEATVEESPDVSLSGRLAQFVRDVDAEPVLLSAPVTEQVGSTMNGTADDRRLYLQASEEGLVMVIVGDSSYTRQAMLRGEYVPNAPDQFDDSTDPRIVVAFQRGAELYPWLFENADGSPSISGFGDSSVYRISADHPHGTTESYVDGSTTNVFREHHSGDPTALPVAATATNETDDHRLRLTLTRPTAPMHVNVTDAAGDPVAANVTVNGQQAGETGVDGQLWTVQPTKPFRVTVTTADGETVLVRSTETASVEA